MSTSQLVACDTRRHAHRHTDLVGSQRDTPPTASTEAALTVAAGVTAAIGKFGFATDSTGGRLHPCRLDSL